MNGKKQLGGDSLLGMGETLGLNPNIEKKNATYMMFPVSCEMCHVFYDQFRTQTAFFQICSLLLISGIWLLKSFLDFQANIKLSLLACRRSLQTRREETREHTLLFPDTNIQVTAFALRIKCLHAIMRDLLPHTSECLVPQFYISPPPPTKIHFTILTCFCVGLCTGVPVEARGSWICTWL